LTTKPKRLRKPQVVPQRWESVASGVFIRFPQEEKRRRNRLCKKAFGRTLTNQEPIEFDDVHRRHQMVIKSHFIQAAIFFVIASRGSHDHHVFRPGFLLGAAAGIDAFRAWVA
jgi:hypothetical protein